MGEMHWSELELIRLFRDTANGPSPGLVKGIGDDCAVFENLDGRQWLTTTDLLVDQVHFDRSFHPPRLLGRKSMAVNFSDIAAMGGRVHFALISLALPASIEKEWIMQWYEGIGDMLAAWGCRLIGGDIARGALLTVNVVAIGSVAHGRAVMRDTARIGETIYVSGPLGSAAAGLEICRNPDRFETIDQRVRDSLRRHHLDPEPELELGSLLGDSGLVGAMQDLSDGLATDLAHIAVQSGVGAEIDAQALPAAEGLDEVAELAGLPKVSLQVSGGEDYRLVFTVKEHGDERLLSLIGERGMGPVYRIGKIIAGSGVLLRKDSACSDISFQGYQHTAGR